MSRHEVRALSESGFRGANDLFRRALLWQPLSDEEWAGNAALHEPGRVLGAFVDGELAGTTRTITNVLAVPGGRRLSAGAVTGVGVRADQTRRGVLTSLMRAQLEEVRERGEAVAMLHASEAVIYERFGYGVATRCRRVELDRPSVTVRAEVPRGGRVRLVDQAKAEPLLPAIYERCGPDRPGRIGRPDAWWSARWSMWGKGLTVAVHADEDGVDDGFVIYEPKTDDNWSTTVRVIDVSAADATAAAELWRFLLDLDLADRLVAGIRPVDEPLEWWLTDRRQCRITTVEDDLWVRLVDVLAAFRARTFGAADPVVVEVRDAFLPENEGRYRVAPDGVDRCSGQPQLSLDVATLAALYLSDQSASALVAAGRIQAHDPAAVPAADSLFATVVPPWCGTSF
ncbi:GNAT family N-acetyltransferase [Saccharopolyspora sp. NPDC000995]